MLIPLLMNLGMLGASVVRGSSGKAKGKGKKPRIRITNLPQAEPIRVEKAEPRIVAYTKIDLPKPIEAKPFVPRMMFAPEPRAYISSLVDIALFELAMRQKRQKEEKEEMDEIMEIAGLEF